MLLKTCLNVNSWLSFKSALFLDSATKSPFHNAFYTTSRYLRGIFKNNSNLPSEIFQKQHRLPVEFRTEHRGGPVSAKFKFISYRPSSIHQIVARWPTQSLTNAWRSELLKKFYRGGSGPMICFVGFALAKKPSLLTDEEELEGVSYLIREAFSTLPLGRQGLSIDSSDYLSNVKLADLKIGKLIAKGCNAAIYSASVEGHDCSYINFSWIENFGYEKPGKCIPVDVKESCISSSNIVPSLEENQKNFGNEKPGKCIPVEVKEDFISSNFFIPSSEENQKNFGYETPGKCIPVKMEDDFINSNFFVTSLKENQRNVSYEKPGKCPSIEINEDLAISNFLNSCSENKQGASIDNDVFGNDNNSVSEKDFDFQPGTFGSYNIAVKVMFNYNAESNAFAIWNAMYKETLPVIGEFSFGETWKHKVRKKKLKPHPNIIEMYTAFADQLPLLPSAVQCYPQALPSRLQDDGCGRNMTLFLVMKRYHCCLKDYLLSQKPGPETALLLFAQLLEALVHLFQNGIAHRDLKTDNILLDLSQGTSSPKLVLADFGCCLESLSLPYTSHDISKGGNMTLMAPEIVNAEPGRSSVIRYSRSDLWAAGAIAYEIFSGSNPFYLNANLKNYSYKEIDLPPFPNDAPAAIQKLVREMLHINPSKRPSQNFAATVCQIILHAPATLLTSPFDNKTNKKALEWMFQFSAQTFLEASLVKLESMPVKLELCRTLCSRIQYLEVIQALRYILEH